MRRPDRPERALWPRALSLEPLSVPEANGAEMVRVAADAGFSHVSMVAHSPTPALPPDPAVSDHEKRREMKACMAATGVRLHNLECFNLLPDVDPKTFAPGLECGADLGAAHATAIVFENADRSDALAKFRRLCAMADEHGIRVNIEFFAGCRSIPDVRAAAAFVTDAGCRNAGLVLDMLHLVRTSGGVAGLGGLDPALIGTIQINDGAIRPPADAQMDMLNRQLPGTGEFPLRDFIRWIPKDAVLGVEVPQLSQFGKVAATERARRMAEAAREVVARAEAQ